jgi:hypothetical protein
MVATLESHELAEGGAPGNPVDREAGIALELGQGARSQVAEDPVDPAGVEAECAQPQLEVCYVVAALHGRTAVEEPIADTKTRFDQGVPRLEAANPVDPQASEMLECLHRSAGTVTEHPVGVHGPAGAEHGV